MQTLNTGPENKFREREREKVRLNRSGSPGKRVAKGPISERHCGRSTELKAGLVGDTWRIE